MEFLQTLLTNKQDIKTAYRLLDERGRYRRISTGSHAFDALLQGGIESHAITEIYGDYGTGKTQLALSLCATVHEQYQHDSSAAQGVLFIDTENTFRAARVYQIAETRGLEPNDVLRDILVFRVADSRSLDLILESLPTFATRYRIALIILDSIIALFRSEYAVNGTLEERQERINKILHVLRSLSEDLGCAVLVTNQIRARDHSKNSSECLQPTGGNILGHGTTYRLWLLKKRRQCLARMIDSPYHANSEAPFAISEMGIVDGEESAVFQP